MLIPDFVHNRDPFYQNQEKTGSPMCYAPNLSYSSFGIQLLVTKCFTLKVRYLSNLIYLMNRQKTKLTFTLNLWLYI